MKINLIVAFSIAFILTLIGIKMMIPFLRRLKYGQTIRKDGPQTHHKKEGTPTMGGVVFIPIALIASLIAMPGLLFDRFAVAIVLVTLGYFAIGFIDDYLIIIKKDNEGLTIRQKLVMQCVIALLFVVLFVKPLPNQVSSLSTFISIPGTKWMFDLGWFYPVLVFVMFVATTNAVNFTDGLDGLASGNMILALIPAILLGLKNGIHSVPIFGLAMVGALLAFLVFNHYPSKIMMGDTGSLPLGALLTALFVILKQEMLLVVVGGIFVLEAISVVLQIGSYKLRNKKRIFKMAPIHHHFELSGWSEKRIVFTFWGIGLVLSILTYFIGAQ